MSGVEPGQSAVVPWLANRDGFATREFQGVDLARHIFGNSIDEFGAGIRGRFIVLNHFGATDISNGRTVGGPPDVVHTHIIVRGCRLGSVGEPAYDQIASVRRTFPRRAVAANKGNTLAIGAWDEIAPRIRFVPHWFRCAPRCGDLPQLSVVRKVDNVAVFTPERALDLALGEQSKRHRLSAAIDIGDVEIGHTRAVPDKRDAFAVW